jgi:hypothetical protein
MPAQQVEQMSAGCMPGEGVEFPMCGSPQAIECFDPRQDLGFDLDRSFAVNSGEFNPSVALYPTFERRW